MRSMAPPGSLQSARASCGGCLTRGDVSQVLPFASEATLSRLEANVGAAGAVTDMLHAGAAPADIAAQLLDGLGTTPGLLLVPRCAPCWRSAFCAPVFPRLPSCHSGVCFCNASLLRY